MNGETAIIYREEQKFASWLRLLVYISMGLAVCISIFALKQEFAEQSSPEILLAIVVGIGVPIVVAALFVFLKLEKLKKLE